MCVKENQRLRLRIDELEQNTADVTARVVERIADEQHQLDIDSKYR